MLLNKQPQKPVRCGSFIKIVRISADFRGKNRQGLSKPAVCRQIVTGMYQNAQPLPKQFLVCPVLRVQQAAPPRTPRLIFLPEILPLYLLMGRVLRKKIIPVRFFPLPLLLFSNEWTAKIRA